MEVFKFKDDFKLMRHALKFNVVSVALFVLAVFFLMTKSLNFSVEFTGGTLVEVSYPSAPKLEDLRTGLSSAGYSDFQVQNFGSTRDILIRLPNRDHADNNTVSQHILAALQTIKQTEPHIKRIEFVGPQVGKELASDGAMALLFVLVGILIYLGLRFEWRFALSAMIAHFHDVVIILGFFACFQWEFSLPVLAATLAVLGYSVNESVIVFDRVRETFRLRRNLTTSEVLDHSVTQTMSRTVITHACTLLIAFSMLFFGGEALHYFALALAIGIICGVYSSIFVSCALVMWFGVTREHFIKPKKEKSDAVV